MRIWQILGLALCLMAAPAAAQDRVSGEVDAPSLAGLTVGGTPVTLYGVRLLGSGAGCERSDGSTWECGAAALEAFRREFQGKRVDCEESPDKRTTGYRCRIGSVDLSGWLVLNGLAQLDDSGVFFAEEQEARQHKAGLFADGPAPADAPAGQ